MVHQRDGTKLIYSKVIYKMEFSKDTGIPYQYLFMTMDNKDGVEDGNQWYHNGQKQKVFQRWK